ncbi:MAG: murein L,D-transpeptidase catalytic domain family protein, partial [Chitinophagaceae bacterium]|nr:murein L,D-transpeptidase catalytic domain family protein [Chitinophagaceae bacterium]
MYLSKKGLLVLGVSGLILGSLAFSTTPSNEKIVSEQKSLTHRDSGIIVAKKTPHPLLSPDLYQKALQGYKQILNYEGLRKSILTIVDFSKPSSEKRMFIIDMNSEKVLMHTYVAHGK